ncbi:MAG: thiamine phosphate synthase, partial [Planctomycetota bacterium]|nr:thiamine phosphate synthase [Planctomycetota bacterium]
TGASPGARLHVYEHIAQLAAGSWAARAGADYLGVGPVFPTSTKAHRQAVGLGYVRYAAKHVALPFFCIGAIKRENIDEVLEAGGRAVAICTAIIGSRDIAKAAAWFKERLLQAEKARGGPRAAAFGKEVKNEKSLGDERGIAVGCLGRQPRCR